MNFDLMLDINKHPFNGQLNRWNSGGVDVHYSHWNHFEKEHQIAEAPALTNSLH